MIIACVFCGLAIVSATAIVICCVKSGQISRQEEEKIKDLAKEELNKK